MKTTSKFRTDMPLLKIELWTDMPLFDSDKWLQISHTAIPLSSSDKRLQTPYCYTSVFIVKMLNLCPQ